MSTLQKTLAIIVILVTLIAIILLIGNDGSFNLFVSIGFAAVITDIIIILFSKKPSYSLAFLGLIGSITVYIYILGYCPLVVFVDNNKNKTERHYFPGEKKIGESTAVFKMADRYIFNNTGRPLYLSKIAYGDAEQQEEYIYKLDTNHLIELSNEDGISWFQSPRERIRVSSSIRGENIVYIDFIPY